MQRLNIQLDEKLYDRLRALGFQTSTPVAEIIRECIDVSIDAVELKLVTGRGGKLVMNPDYMLRLSGLAGEVERSALTHAEFVQPPTEKTTSEEPKR